MNDTSIECVASATRYMKPQLAFEGLKDAR